MCVRKLFYFHFQYLFLRNLKIVTGVKVSLLQLFLCNITNIVGSSCGGLVGLPVDGPDGSSLHEQPKWRSSLLQPRPGRPPLVATNMVHPQSVLPVGAWWAEPAPHRHTRHHTRRHHRHRQCHHGQHYVIREHSARWPREESIV